MFNRERRPMPNHIPNQLAYLAPVLDELLQIDSEDLDEDNPEALDIIEVAVRRRVKGMSAAEASQTIRSDANLLQQWMSRAEAPDTAAFAYGALFGISLFADFNEFTS